VSDDPQFAAVRRGQIGSPVLVSSPHGAPAFWLVPFHIDGHACGIARVELTAGVSQIATFGSGPDDRAAWPDLSFFDRPPTQFLSEAMQRHPTLRVDAARLSYDATPAKWGWRIETRDGATVVFITPGGWYGSTSRRSSDPNREG
jgi:hypothetical protein